MTIIQVSLALAITAAGSAAATAITIHATAPAPVTCAAPSNSAQFWRNFQGQMPATTGGQTMQFK